MYSARREGYMQRHRCPACGMAELVDEGEGLCCPQCLYKPGPRPKAPEVVRFEIPRRRPSGGSGKATRRAA